MDALPPATSLLEDLDRRQDDVLMQLDELDRRLAALLSEYSGGRPAPLASAVPQQPTAPVLDIFGMVNG